MKYFTTDDANALNKLKYDPDLSPSYDPLRECLMWHDEVPDIGGDGYMRFKDLLIIRSYIHLEKPKSEWYTRQMERGNPYFVELWEEALNIANSWPGFKRLTLSVDDRKYFESLRKKGLEEFL